MFFWLVVVGLALLAALLARYLSVSGIFHKIEVTTGEPPFGNLHVVYKFYQNSYSEAGTAFNELNMTLATVFATTNIHNKSVKKIGIYYDDPAIVAKGKQRYIIGIVVEKESDMDIECLLQNGYNSVFMNRIDNAVLANFPCTTVLSIFLSIWRVYPKLKFFIKDKKLCAYPFIEYYYNNRTNFVVPLCKQDSFLVPELFSEKTE